MSTPKTIASNKTEGRYAVETSPGVVAANAVWNAVEPNEWSDFGAEVQLVARNPINASRQRKKGVVVGYSAAGGFQSDLTHTNLRGLLEGFLFADTRAQASFVVSSIAVDGLNVAAGGALQAGTLVKLSGSEVAGNNGVHVVAAGSTATKIAIDGLSADPGAAVAVVVGLQFTAGAASIDATAGGYPVLVSTAETFTSYGLVPGAWVYLGGDAAGTRFGTAANAGWARVKAVAADRLTFDKTDLEYADDAGATKTVRVFFGSFLKNELGELVKARTYQIERSLGAPDTAQPSQVQGEYITGAMANELTLNFSEKEKITADISFIAQDYETRSGTTGLKTGSRPANVENDALDTSNALKRARLAVISDTSAAPDPLFALVLNAELTVNNNISENAALGYAGSVELTPGTFEVGGSLMAYFASVAATQAVRDNDDVTFDMALAKDNAGVVVDLPLIALGNGRLEVEQDRPIMLPLDMQASTGAKYDPAFDYTLGFTFFDFLPDAASAKVL